MHQDGLSYTEIAAYCGISRSAVAGHVYRAKIKIGLVKPSYRPRRDRSAGKDRRDQPRLRGPNRAKDPETRKVVELINASRLYDTEIADLSGVDVSTLRKWRSGVRPGKAIFLEWVREAISRS